MVGTCSGDKNNVHMICARHTHENVAGTCFRDMLQRHVPSCCPDSRDFVSLIT